MIKKYTLASFFAGVGGIDLAFENEGFKAIYANELDENAVKTYKENFPEVSIVNYDIAKLEPTSVPDVDIIVGGFPCQAFSIAGYRKGFDDQRGVLFFDLMRIVEEKKPRVIFAENVRNLVSHDNGNTFKVMTETLEHLGYKYKYVTMNTLNYSSLPQNRDRVYIVAFLDHSLVDLFEFPIQTNNTIPINEFIDFGSRVPEKYYYSKYKNIADAFKNIAINNESVYQWRRHYVRANKKGVCPTLTANMGTGGHNVPLIFTQYGLRKLTPRECFKLQGFPEGFKLPGINDSQLYKQAGNSVSIEVVQRIAKNIYDTLRLKDTNHKKIIHQSFDI